MQFYLKIYQNGKEKIGAICDETIKGKSYLHNGVKITVKSDFYGDQLFEGDEVLLEVMSCTSINAFGSKICNLLVENRIAHPKSILWLKDGENSVGHVIIVK